MRRLACAGLLLALGATAQPPSSFNGLLPPALDSSGAHRMVFSGHFYGGSHSRSGYPAATVLANVDTLNALGAGVMLLTGDLFVEPVSDAQRHGAALYRRLNMPVYNAVGNHDLAGGRYEELFGATFMAFDRGPDRIIILDSERDNSKILGPQLELLEQAARDAGEGRLRHIFIVSHRPVWAEDDRELGELFRHNTRSMLGTNFERDVRPLLDRMRSHARVYWVSGSMGGFAPASVFHHEEAEGLFFLQTAIRDEPRDAVLVADVGEEHVRWWLVSLTGSKVGNVEGYDAAYWRKHMGVAGEGFNWRLMPLHVRNTVTHRAFWLGGALALLAMAVLRRLLRRGL